MKSMIRLWMSCLCLSAIAGMGFWSCNVSDPGDAFFLKVEVNDTLSLEAGKYDTLEIDLLDTSGAVVQSHLFFGTYSVSDSAKLAKLALNARPPEPFIVRITAHSKTTNDVLVLSNLVAGGVPLPQIIVIIPGTVPIEVPPTQIKIAIPFSHFLYVGDTLSLAAEIAEANVAKGILWTVSNPANAEVLSNTKLVGLVAGEFVLKVASTAALTVSDSIRMTVLPVPTSLPQSVVIANQNPLEIVAGGASIFLAASVLPVDANQTIVWTLPPSDFAVLEVGNKIKGLKPGNVKVTASSSKAPSIFAVLDVTIIPSAQPTDIELRMPVPMTLAPNGAASTIIWAVLPATVNQEVVWTSSDTTIAQVTLDNKIKPGALGKATITGASKLNPLITKQFEVNVVAVVQVDSITVSPKTLKLFKGGSDGQLTVTMSGSDTGAKYVLTSSNAAIASVSVLGAVKGLQAGSAQITASVLGFPSIASVCSVTVVTDTPMVTITPDQSIAYGGEATFKVSVQQEYGTVAEIKADMDGDGVYEKTLLALDSATFTATYSQVKVFNLAFQVKDSEGNVVDVTRKVTVAAPAAPTVKIVDPASAITVNTSTYTVKFTVKDPTKAIDEAKDSVITLVDGTNTIVVSRTNAGGTTTQQVVITLDKTAPGIPVFAAQPAFTTDNTPTWTWGAITGAAKYQVRLDDSSFTKATGTTDITVTTYTAAALIDGKHTLYVRSVDDLGNASSPASQAVTVDTKAPDAVNFTGIDLSYTASTTPTWTWSPSTTNGGTGAYVLKLDTGAEFDWTSTTFSPTTALSDNATHVLTVKEKDQVPGVTGVAKSFSYRVKVNPPSAPIVKSASNVANNGLTNNPNFSWTSGGGGNGKYRVRLNSETTYRINAVAQTAWSLATTDADGVYAIHVSEQDDMGRWGTEGNFAITLDRTAPQFANAKIEGKTYALRDGYITNAAALVINYTADGAAKQLSCALTNNASTICKGAAITDAAGNSSTYQVTIWRRSNVIFFTTTGNGDGSSWEDAASDIQSVVDQAGSDGKDFWLASGNYTTKNNSLSIWGKTVNMFGGFLLTNYPTSTTGRTKGASILAHISFMGSNGNFDGLQFNPSSSGLGLGLGALGTDASPATFVDCIFKGGFETPLGGSIRFTNCQMTGVSNGYISMNISSGTIVWTGGSITNNTPGSGYTAIEIASSATATFNGALTISGNKPSFEPYQIRNYGNLTIATSVTIPCTDIIWETGSSGSCK